MSFSLQTYVYSMLLFPHMFLFRFHSWPYILNVQICSDKCVNILSIAVHVFRKFFGKICPLSGKILITCLKCSRASFLPSSYSENMRWEQGFCQGTSKIRDFLSNLHIGKISSVQNFQF